MTTPRDAAPKCSNPGGCLEPDNCPREGCCVCDMPLGYTRFAPPEGAASPAPASAEPPKVYWCAVHARPCITPTECYSDTGCIHGFHQRNSMPVVRKDQRSAADAPTREDGEKEKDKADSRRSPVQPATSAVAAPAAPSDGLPESVWVVFDSISECSLAMNSRDTAMEHAGHMADDSPSRGPWRVQEYRRVR